MALLNALLRARASRSIARRSAIAIAAVAHLVGVAAAASAVVLVPSEASAEEPAKRKVLAVHVEGQNAADAREDILSVLPDRITVVDKGDVTAAMRKFGLSKPMGSAMTQAKSRTGLLPRLRKAAKQMDADGFIVGIVQRYSGKWRVYVVWLSPDGNELLVDEAVSREGSEADRRSALEGALSGVIEQFSPKPVEKPKDDKPTPTPEAGEKDGSDESDDKPARVRHEAGSSIFAVEVGVEATGRRFDFSDGLSTNLRSYELFGAPVAFASAEVYPAGFTTVPVLRDIGLTIGYARAFALQSATADGTPVNTLYQRFSAGIRYRIPISRPTGPVLGLSGQYYMHTFNVDEPPELAGQVPNVDYSAIRAGIDGRFPIGRAAIVAGFDWIEPLSAGPVYDRFTGVGVHGIGGKVGLVVRIASGFELRFAAEYARFFSDFDPVLGDAYVAGGALDQYLGLRLSGAYVE
ncbi:MAG: hypothetical protein IPM54_37755 [Polyangiaceae bacterium]|nr:hypothetical protein [Polyangiaceae bacterium]